jgi:hypothetical protein
MIGFIVEKTDLGFCDGANKRWEVYKNTKPLVVPEWDYLLKMLDFLVQTEKSLMRTNVRYWFCSPSFARAFTAFLCIGFVGAKEIELEICIATLHTF